MSSIDNEQFIKTVKTCLIFTGLWKKPLKQNWMLRKCFQFYQFAAPSLFYLIYLLITVELLRLVIVRSDLEYFIGILGITITETRVIGRLIAFSKNKILNMLDDVIREEEKIWNLGDQEVNLIYSRYIKSSRTFMLCQCFTTALAIGTFSVTGRSNASHFLLNSLMIHFRYHRQL